MGSMQSSTQAMIDHGIRCNQEEQLIIQNLKIQDPKLEAILRAYIHARKENYTERGASRRYCCF